MYTEASYGRRGDTATMTFSLIKPADKNGVSFIYHMSGDDLGSLTVSAYCIFFTVLFKSQDGGSYIQI